MARAHEETGECPACGYERPARGWPVDAHVGRTINGKYRLVSRLGAGGFAMVFRARQVRGAIDLGDVVLKFLHQNLAADVSVRRRFVNEARASRKVNSPHAVKVFDLDFDEDGTPFMVMELLEGVSLDARLHEVGRLSPRRTFRIGLQVATALEECHTAGIIHRDLKPDNLLLLHGRTEDFVKVLDFGIARVPTAGQAMTSTLMGTPRYMAPEQIRQHEMDEGVDIFALGVILYECLAGRPPLRADTPMAYLEANLTSAPAPLRESCPELPGELEGLLASMMAKDRDERPASMAEVEERLQAMGQERGWVPRKVRPTDEEGDPVEVPEGFDATGPTARPGAPEEPLDTDEALGLRDTVLAPEKRVDEAPSPVTAPTVKDRRFPVWALAAVAVALGTGVAVLATLSGKDDPPVKIPAKDSPSLAPPGPAASGPGAVPGEDAARPPGGEPSATVAPGPDASRPPLSARQRGTIKRSRTTPLKKKTVTAPPAKKPAAVNDKYGTPSGGL